MQIDQRHFKDIYFQSFLSIMIRHFGLARDYKFFVSLHEGLLYFAIYDATDLIGAYTKAKKTMV